MTRPTRKILAALIVVGVAWIAQQAGFDPASLTRSAGSAIPSRSDSPRDVVARASEGNQRIEEALARRESGFMVTVDARVA